MAVNSQNFSNASPEKLATLKNAISQLKKAYGDDSIRQMDEKVEVDKQAISTGSLGLDIALGIGGFPRGRIIEIYGEESSGKTTLALHVIAEAQKRGGVGALIDVEHAFDPLYAKKLGVKLDELVVSQPDYGEKALEIADSLVRSGAIDVLVIDSVAALTPKAEIDGDMGDSHMGLQARLMSQALRKITASVSKSNCIIIFINQTRMKIGVMFGNPQTTTGGNALKFYSSVRVEIKRVSAIKSTDKNNDDGSEAVGNLTRARVVKNKVAPPFRVVEFDIMYGVGISKVGEILDIGVKAGFIDKSGSWFNYEGNKIGQGRENAKKYLQSNPDIADKLEEKIRKKYLDEQNIDMELLSFSSHEVGGGEEEKEMLLESVED